MSFSKAGIKRFNESKGLLNVFMHNFTCLQKAAAIYISTLVITIYVTLYKVGNYP